MIHRLPKKKTMITLHRRSASKPKTKGACHPSLCRISLSKTIRYPFATSNLLANILLLTSKQGFDSLQLPMSVVTLVTDRLFGKPKTTFLAVGRIKMVMECPVLSGCCCLMHRVLDCLPCVACLPCLVMRSLPFNAHPLRLLMA